MMANKFAIWSTKCPSCSDGLILLYEKGGTAKCDKCKHEYNTDFEEHPELSCPQTEYWTTDAVTGNIHDKE